HILGIGDGGISHDGGGENKAVVETFIVVHSRRACRNGSSSATCRDIVSGAQAVLRRWFFSSTPRYIRQRHGWQRRRPPRQFFGAERLPDRRNYHRAAFSR